MSLLEFVQNRGHGIFVKNDHWGSLFSNPSPNVGWLQKARPCKDFAIPFQRSSSCDPTLKIWSQNLKPNRTVTVWQTMQVLSDNLTSRCVTSYLSALVTSITNSCATNRFITSCSCVVGKSWTVMSPTKGLNHKPNSHCVTNYAGTIWQTN